MSSEQRPLAVTMGDPAGVGPLIAWSAWEQRRTTQRPFYVIGDPAVAEMARIFRGLPGKAQLISQPSDAAEAFADGLPIMPMPCPIVPVPGSPDVKTAPAITGWIERAVADVQSGAAAGLVTNPISKALLYEAGFAHPGHTEFLAHLSTPSETKPRVVMMLVGGGLRVALATIHMPLMQVGGALSGGLIEEVAEIVATSLIRDFGIAAPRIGLCGLNPHAGESGSLGREEVDIINPAANALRENGLDISDARPGDTVFHEALEGQYDAVIAMYHDQGLIPVKTLDIWGGVNTTLGLPFIRTSPDHGTAYDAAANGQVRADSLIAALDLADKFATTRELGA